MGYLLVFNVDKYRMLENYYIVILVVYVMLLVVFSLFLIVLRWVDWGGEIVYLWDRVFLRTWDFFCYYGCFMWFLGRRFYCFKIIRDEVNCV